MCANTENNRRWLEQVNEVLLALYQDPHFLQVHFKYMQPYEKTTIQNAIAAELAQR